MPAIVRKGDTLTTGHACVGTTTLDTPGQSTVFANNILVARCPNHVATVNAGSPNVFVVGIQVGRIGDSADAGAMISGSPNVFANG